jgi:hypothetical protein
MLFPTGPDNGIGAHRIGCGREANRAKDEGDGEVSEKPLKTTNFPVLTYSREPELVPLWAAGVARDKRNGKNSSN